MAIIHELEHSREGATIGADTVSGENMLLSVTAEDSDIVEVKDGDGTVIHRYLPDPRSLVQTSGYAPLGSTHPWNATLQAYAYTVVNRQGRRNWTVRVEFKRTTTEALPTSGEWLINIRGATLARRIIEELPSHESRLSKTKKAPTALASEPPRLIGPTVFKKVRTAVLEPHELFPELTGFQTEETDSEGNVKTIYLKPTKRRMVMGYQTTWPAMTVNLTRIIPNFQLDRDTGRTAQYQKTVNDRWFRGAQAAHVRLSEMSIDPINAEMRGQKVPGRAWRVTLSFLWSAQAFTPLELVPTHRDDRGFESVITDADGNKIVEAFRVERARNLESFMSIFEGRRG